MWLDLINEEFIEAFLDCFDILTVEKELDHSVQIICNFNTNKNVSKMIMEAFDTHKYSRKLVDYLLFLLNKVEDKDIIFDICNLIADLLDHTKSSLFYKNDLDSFMIIAIKTLESTYSNELRYHFLNLLNKICSYKDYFESKYKLDILVEILEDYQQNDHVGENNQTLSTEILEKIEKNW